ncbi:MAG: SPOR domain-containing protein [Gammaproteobacteria bacterium]|nr:SPOR domain-containing protein [Gammaproteobacteria bacterium]
MDRQLAQRMVGAACLLAVLVLVVPAILDGNPDSDAIISRPAVDDAMDLRTHTIRLDGEDREPPVPTPLQVDPGADSVSPQAAPPEAERAEAAVPEPSPKESPRIPVATVPRAEPEAVREPVRDLSREPVTPVETAPTPTRGGDWIVQLGSFSQRANADRLAADLERKGFSVSVESGGGTSGNLIRVRAGPVADRAAAEALARQLAAAGFKGGRVGRQ